VGAWSDHVVLVLVVVVVVVVVLVIVVVRAADTSCAMLRDLLTALTVARL